MINEEIILSIIENLNKDKDNKIKSVKEYFKIACMNANVKCTEDLINSDIIELLMCIGYDAALFDVTTIIPTESSSTTKYLN